MVVVFADDPTGRISYFGTICGIAQITGLLGWIVTGDLKSTKGAMLKSSLIGQRKRRSIIKCSYGLEAKPQPTDLQSDILPIDL